MHPYVMRQHTSQTVVVVAVRQSELDIRTRARVAAWLAYYRKKYGHQYKTHAALAAALNLSQATVVNILNRRRTPGLEVLLRMHRVFHVSTDTLLDTDPPDQAED